LAARFLPKIVPASTVAANFFKYAYNFLNFLETFLVAKAIIFNDSLDFLQCSIALPFNQFLYRFFCSLKGNLNLTLHHALYKNISA